MIPTGKSTAYGKYKKISRIGNETFDTCFKVNQEEVIADTILLDDAIRGGITIWQETGEYKYNFLQVYTPADRKRIAIEPMTCMPDSFNNKEGLIILKPDQAIRVAWGLKKIMN